MKHVKLNTSELSEIYTYYQSKYENEQQRAEELRQLIAKWERMLVLQEETAQLFLDIDQDVLDETQSAGAASEKTPAAPSEKKKSGKPTSKKSKSAASKSKKQSTRAQKAQKAQKKETQPAKDPYEEVADMIRSLDWQSAILKVLEQNQVLYSLEDFVYDAIYIRRLPQTHESLINSIIIQESFNLVHNKKIVRYIFKDDPDLLGFFGLPEWFDEAGEPYEQYLGDDEGEESQEQ